MMRTFKAVIARHWPVLRLRTILLGTLLFVAALPGFGAVFLRVYENALVRRTEAELVAQSAALAAAMALDWPEGAAGAGVVPSPDSARSSREGYTDNPTEIDLRSSAILPSRPPARPTTQTQDGPAGQVAAHFAPALQETRRATLSSIILIDRNGIVITGPERGRTLGFLPEVQSALRGRSTTVLRINEHYGDHYPFEWLSRAANIRLHHARPVTAGDKVVGVLLVSRSPRALFRGIYEDRGKIALGVALIFVMLLAISAVLARSIVRPIENLTRATRALSSGRSIEPSRPSLQVVEIRDLFNDFEVMAQNIEKRSRYLRDFASSVSHEFKTPLAAISGAIELLQDHGETMSAPDRQRFLDNMAGDAQRLSRLVRRLMELAQADLRVEDVSELTKIAPIMLAIADGFSGRDFAVRLSDLALLPAAKIDADALEAVVVTALENARQAGAKSVVIRGETSGGDVCLDLIDDGPGVPEGDRERIFDPFFTSKRDSGGTGLGLSIARSLLQAYGGALTLLPSSAGAHFRISLKAG